MLLPARIRRSRPRGSWDRPCKSGSDEMVADGEVLDATYAPLSARFGPRAVINLARTAAFYICVSRMAASLRIRSNPISSIR